jgi:hypothetical protein
MPKGGGWLKPNVYGMSRYVSDGGFLSQRERSPKLRVIHLFQQKGASELFPSIFNGQYALIAYTLSFFQLLVFNPASMSLERGFVNTSLNL